MKRSAMALSWRFVRVWRRNVLVNRHSWHTGFLVPLLEPIFYVTAFGIGFRTLIGDVTYQGIPVPYTQFIAPALIATGIMQNAFFETTFTSFVRMYYQKTFDAIMATPISIEEVVTGEIVWGATRSVIAAVIMLAVLGVCGLIRFPSGLAIVAVALLGGLAFGAAGMVFTGLVKNIDQFNLPIFLFITPMFLFSGTFFPIDTLPNWARHTAQALPLTHLVTLTRALAFGTATLRETWLAVTYLLAFTAVTFPLALLLMHRRLVR